MLVSGYKRTAYIFSMEVLANRFQSRHAELLSVAARPIDALGVAASKAIAEAILHAVRMAPTLAGCQDRVLCLLHSPNTSFACLVWPLTCCQGVGRLRSMPEVARFAA